MITNMKKWCLFLIPLQLFCSSLTTLYSTLDPTSVAQHFAFYELHPNTPEGKTALQHAWDLLSGGCTDCEPEVLFPTVDAHPIIALVNRSTNDAPVLEDDQLRVIERLARHLPNRKLKGSKIWSWAELIALPFEEVDVARALLIADLESNQQKIRSYEATLDLMALQILARLKENATPFDKIRLINDYIFSELQFRFPPHSLYAEDIDLYTLLPAVIESRKGVCLGVSILYLSLAQRLDLPLQAITPPGHIYVRYEPPEALEVNIETTARGIDVPSEYYLSLETRKLQKRNLKEVVGLAFMNQAAVAWHREDHQAAIGLYEKGLSFLPNDPLITTFLGFQYLFVGNEKKGKELLESVRSVLPDHLVTVDPAAEDFLQGKTSAAAIQALFQEVDQTRESILKKQKQLQEFPESRSVLYHLAITHLQLGREKEAIPILERYMQLDATNPTVAYYLAALYTHRLHFAAAWKYLKIAESLTAARDHYPRALTDLRKELERSSPQPHGTL